MWWGSNAPPEPSDRVQAARSSSHLSVAEGPQLTVRGQRLLNQDQQYWALGLGVLVPPLVIWSASASLSCFHPGEDGKADAPSKCPNLDKSAQELRLPDFCFKSCMGENMTPLLGLLAASVALQFLVVMANHDDCQRWGRVTRYFDMQSGMDQVDQELEGLQEEQHGFFKRKIIAVVHKVGVLIVNQVRTTAQNRDHYSTSPAEWTHRVSQLCGLGVVLFVARIHWTRIYPFPVFFTCDDGSADARTELKAKWSKYHLMGAVVALVLQCIVLLLQLRAKWTLQVEIKGGVEEGVLGDLKQQFTETLFPKQSREKLGKSDAKKAGGKSDDTLMPAFKKFEEAHLKQLVYVEHDGYMDAPKNAFSCKKWEEPVVFHFKGWSLSWEDLPDNVHRLFGFLCILFGTFCFFVAANGCWTCVDEINVKQSISAINLDHNLLLLGACGRHAHVGKASSMAFALLFLSLLLQAMVAKLTDAKYNGGRAIQWAVKEAFQKTNHTQQMWLKLCDSGEEGPEQLAAYTRAGPELPKPQLWSYIWVTGGDDDNPGAAEQEKEQVMSCTGRAEGREKWRQSKFPRKVELCNPPEEHDKLVKNMEGLWREDYGPPTVCILILEGEDYVRQMVPPQFIAGRFHMWVNLGPKHAWELMAGGLSFCAFMLGTVDGLAYFLVPRGRTLQSCSDVLNRRCILLNRDDQTLKFRSSTGVYAALAGAGCALLACLCFRVAVKLDGEHSKVKAVMEYIQAPFYIFRMAFDSLKFVFGSIWRCVHSWSKKHFCAAKKAEQQQGRVEEEQELLVETARCRTTTKESASA